MAYLHSDEVALSFREGGTLRTAGYYSLLTDATVASADTVTGLSAAVVAAQVHADFDPPKNRVTRTITIGANIGDLTDALIAPLTTVVGLVNLTQAGPENNMDLLLG